MKCDDAVSVVVGEMLMIALVAVLIAAAAAAFPVLLPSDRSVSANILVMYDDHTNNLSLYHKGGDWMRISELVVSAEYPDGSREIRRNGDTGFVLEPYAGLELAAGTKKQTFDLGDVLNVSLVNKPAKVKVSTANSVVVTAEV